MGLFGKRKKEKIEVREGELPDLTDLPSLPELPPLPEEREAGLSQLPTLPADTRGIDNEIVKAAVSDDLRSESLVKPRTREISGREMDIRSIMDRRTRELPTKLREETAEAVPPRPGFVIPSFVPQRAVEERVQGPIFVQIDKFEGALSSFTDIKRKIGEIGDLLKDIREVRQREEQELSDWEREIESIKARIDTIDNQIFKKLD